MRFNFQTTADLRWTKLAGTDIQNLMLRERNQSPRRSIMIKLIAPYNKLSWLRQAQKCYKADDGTSSSRGSGWRTTRKYTQPSSTSTTAAQVKQNKPDLLFPGKNCKHFIQLFPRPREKTEQNSSPDLLFPSTGFIARFPPQTDLLRSLSTFSDWFASLGKDSVAGAGAAGPSLPPDVAVPVLWVRGAASEIGQTRGWNLYYWWKIPNFPSVTENVIHFKRLQN